MVLATNPSAAFRSLYELGFATHGAAAVAMTPAAAEVGFDTDPHAAAAVDAARKRGTNVKAVVRRVWVVGSKGAGKVSWSRSQQAEQSQPQAYAQWACCVAAMASHLMPREALTSPVRPLPPLAYTIQTTTILHFLLGGAAGIREHVDRICTATIAATASTAGGGAGSDDTPVPSTTSPAPTTEPTHYVAPVPSSRVADDTASESAPSHVATAAAQDGLRHRALPETLVITEWPAETVHDAMAAAAAQCDTMLVVVDPAQPASIAFFWEVVEQVSTPSEGENEWEGGWVDAESLRGVRACVRVCVRAGARWRGCGGGCSTAACSIELGGGAGDAGRLGGVGGAVRHGCSRGGPQVAGAGSPGQCEGWQHRGHALGGVPAEADLLAAAERGPVPLLRSRRGGSHPQPATHDRTAGAHGVGGAQAATVGRRRSVGGGGRRRGRVCAAQAHQGGSGWGGGQVVEARDGGQAVRVGGWVEE